MLVESIISYFNKKIILKTNDDILFNELKNEYKEYFRFHDMINENDIIKLKILNSEKVYDKYFDRARKNRNKIDKVYIGIRRENIVIVDKCNNEVCIIYKNYNDEKLQYIEEMICSIFGKLLENEGFFFIRGICISKGNKGVLILCDKNIEETELLLKMLESGFEFLSKTQLGIKEYNGIAIPIRLGLTESGVEKSKINAKYIKEIRSTQGFKDYQKEKEISNEENEKFSIKVKEINEIFGLEAISKTKIEIIVNLHKSNNVDKAQIIKMRKDELTELFLSKKISSIYKPLIYLENLFNQSENNKYLSNIIKQPYINTYKIFTNTQSISETINFIKEKIEEN